MDNSKNFARASAIQAIDKRSVHQLCSGQVILSLATAVKELVENSIDAGATNVEIKLKEFGIESIEVHDNGSGIEEKDFEAIATKHCTSKLTDFSDLTMIETFGFRGEALSSLCAVSKLTVITRHLSKPFGSKLEFDCDGKLASRTSCAREIGTTVIANQLFYTLPVRHKEFQRNIKKEFPKLSAVLQAYGIISTGVRLSCVNVTDKNRKTTIVSTLGSDSILDNIANIFGPKQVQNLLAITQKEPTYEVLEHFRISPKTANESKNCIKIDGYISRVDHGCGRASPDRQFYFINKRPCDIAKVSRVINEVYHMFNRQQNPFIFLDIRLDSGMVDVNLTPDKRQIFVQHEKMLLATLKTTLLCMFTETAGQYEINSKVQEVPTAFLTSDQTDIQHRSISSFCESPLESRNKIDKPSFDSRRELCKQRSSILSVAVNGGSPISSALKSLNRKFSRSPNVENTQMRIEKFTYAIEKEKASKRETEQGAKSAKLCGRDEPGDLNPSKMCCITSVPIVDRPSLCSNGTLQRRLSHEQDDNIWPEKMDDNCITTLQTMERCSKAVQNSGESAESALNKECPICEVEDLSMKNNKLDYNCIAIPETMERCNKAVQNSGESTESAFNEECPICEVEDLSMKNNIMRRSAEIETSSAVTLASKQALSNSDTQMTNALVESPPLKQRESINGVAHGNDLASFSSSEKPCKKIRFSRPEVKVPFDIEKLRRDLELHSPRRIYDHERQLGFHAKISPNQNGAAEEELRKNITKEMFMNMEVIGQFNLGFIIAKIHEDLFIIDQHASDEKFNFETLQKEHCLKGQKLIHPRPLELTPTNESILMDNMEIFRKNGYEFLTDDTQPSGSKVKLTSLPTSRNWTFGIEDIEELLFMLSDSPGVMCRPSRVRNMFASRACRVSIMVGTALSQGQMKTLLNHMAQIEHPWNCPHGRPTMRHLVNLNRIVKKTDSHCQSEE